MTKILLVEDDKSLREIYGVRLLAEGYDIVSAGDGEEALAMAIKERPQLIVSDVMMPKISGFDMLDILRSTTETKDIKVIMMTALSSEDQRQRGEQLGANRYLVKSQVGIEDVVRTVHEVLEDAPVTQPSFTSAPAAQPTPAASVPHPAPPAPQQPAAPAAPQPSFTQPPSAPASSAPSGLPQPTAPFSSPRPLTLGERVIQPLDNGPQTDDSAELAARIAAELGQEPVQPASVAAAPAPVTPQAATPTPIPDPVPQLVNSTPAPQPTAPQSAPAPAPAPPQPSFNQPQPAPAPAAPSGLPQPTTSAPQTTMSAPAMPATPTQTFQPPAVSQPPQQP
jgi:CheY-like chemotaxis protein